MKREATNTRILGIPSRVEESYSAAHANLHILTMQAAIAFREVIERRRPPDDGASGGNKCRTKMRIAKRAKPRIPFDGLAEVK
jgi:hypothetical protein